MRKRNWEWFFSGLITIHLSLRFYDIWYVSISYNTYSEHSRIPGNLLYNQHTATWRIFEFVFLENEVSNERMLLFFFDPFLHVQSPSDRLYRDFGDTPYITGIDLQNVLKLNFHFRRGNCKRRRLLSSSRFQPTATFSAIFLHNIIVN